MKDFQTTGDACCHAKRLSSTSQYEISLLFCW